MKLEELQGKVGETIGTSDWFLLDQDRQEQGERVVLGFGDSLSDLGFLGECHWWGTPRQGQIAHWLADELADHLQRKGRYDHAPDFD